MLVCLTLSNDLRLATPSTHPPLEIFGGLGRDSGEPERSKTANFPIETASGFCPLFQQPTSRQLESKFVILVRHPINQKIKEYKKIPFRSVSARLSQYVEHAEPATVGCLGAISLPVFIVYGFMCLCVLLFSQSATSNQLPDCERSICD